MSRQRVAATANIEHPQRLIGQAFGEVVGHLGVDLDIAVFEVVGILERVVAVHQMVEDQLLDRLVVGPRQVVGDPDAVVGRLVQTAGARRLIPAIFR